MGQVVIRQRGSLNWRGNARKVRSHVNLDSAGSSNGGASLGTFDGRRIWLYNISSAISCKAAVVNFVYSENAYENASPKSFRLNPRSPPCRRKGSYSRPPCRRTRSSPSWAATWPPIAACPSRCVWLRRPSCRWTTPSPCHPWRH